MALHRQPAVPVYLLLTGGMAFLFEMLATVNLVYQVETVGLNPFQLLLVGAVLELTAFLGETPTGVVADVYSRRLSVIIGVALWGTGFLIEGLFPVLGAVLLAQVVWGLGYTFTSGATEAWIVDEAGEERAASVLLRGAQFAQVATFCGIVSGALLATVRLNLPLVVSGSGMLLLALVLALIMPETNFRPVDRSERGNWGTMRATFLGGIAAVRGRPLLTTLMLITAIGGVASEGFDRLNTKFLIDNIGLPGFGGWDSVLWFGALRATAMLFSLGLLTLVRRDMARHPERSPARKLTVLTAAVVAGMAVFALAPSFWVAAAAYLGIAVARRVSAPVLSVWLNQQIDARVRATVLSMRGQVDSFGQILGGPVVGVVGTVVSVRAALTVSAAALTPALALYARVAARGRDAEPLADAAVLESSSPGD